MTDDMTPEDGVPLGEPTPGDGAPVPETTPNAGPPVGGSATPVEASAAHQTTTPDVNSAASAAATPAAGDVKLVTTPPAARRTRISRRTAIEAVAGFTAACFGFGWLARNGLRQLTAALDLPPYAELPVWGVVGGTQIDDAVRHVSCLIRPTGLVTTDKTHYGQPTLGGGVGIGLEDQLTGWGVFASLVPEGQLMRPVVTVSVPTDPFAQPAHNARWPTLAGTSLQPFVTYPNSWWLNSDLHEPNGLDYAIEVLPEVLGDESAGPALASVRVEFRRYVSKPELGVDRYPVPIATFACNLPEGVYVPERPLVGLLATDVSGTRRLSPGHHEIREIRFNGSPANLPYPEGRTYDETLPPAYPGWADGSFQATVDRDGVPRPVVTPEPQL